MSDTEVPPEVENEIDDVQQLLEKLIPPEKIEIRDIYGNCYKVRGSLPARRQVKVFRYAEDLLSMATDTVDTSSIRATGMASVGQLFIKLATNEDILEKLCNMFAEAHPKVVASAFECASKNGDEADHVADVFAVEDIVEGLLPFFIRLATKFLGLAKAVATTAEKTN